MFCKRSRNEKNKITRKTKGKAKNVTWCRRKEGANRQRDSMSIDYLVDRIDRPDLVGKTLEKRGAMGENEKRRKKREEGSGKSFHTSRTRELNSVLYGNRQFSSETGKRNPKDANRLKSRPIPSGPIHKRIGLD